MHLSAVSPGDLHAYAPAFNLECERLDHSLNNEVDILLVSLIRNEFKLLDLHLLDLIRVVVPHGSSSLFDGVNKLEGRRVLFLNVFNHGSVGPNLGLQIAVLVREPLEVGVAELAAGQDAV